MNNNDLRFSKFYRIDEILSTWETPLGTTILILAIIDKECSVIVDTWDYDRETKLDELGGINGGNSIRQIYKKKTIEEAREFFEEYKNYALLFEENCSGDSEEETLLLEKLNEKKIIKMEQDLIKKYSKVNNK